MQTRMTRFCLTCARLCSAMWVGAALLFVMTSVAEQRWPLFDAQTKDELALIRFPWYYGLGLTLICASGVAAGVARRRGPAAVLSAALIVMNLDHCFIFLPLCDSFDPPGGGRGANFAVLHRWSEAANTVTFLLTAMAAAMLCRDADRPSHPPAERGASAP